MYSFSGFLTHSSTFLKYVLNKSVSFPDSMDLFLDFRDLFEKFSFPDFKLGTEFTHVIVKTWVVDLVARMAALQTQPCFHHNFKQSLSFISTYVAFGVVHCSIPLTIGVPYCRKWNQISLGATPTLNRIPKSVRKGSHSQKRCSAAIQDAHVFAAFKWEAESQLSCASLKPEQQQTDYHFSFLHLSHSHLRWTFQVILSIVAVLVPGQSRHEFVTGDLSAACDTFVVFSHTCTVICSWRAVKIPSFFEFAAFNALIALR